ncbi:hypothetical protein FH972_022404 [Carpinus fangiana]|uniref:Clathrin/coatomer adaptor adaptin-like N-terminal domain-containing protein n=1 Tax=Carpinus fangiana TaxID=176857 RepID=A0A5N6KSU0_9ROSI|nr:hypothetical protein FH972_022404 [Carpinus fangiana]
MSGIRVPVISQIVALGIKRGCADMSPLVRRAAALAIPKCRKLDPGTEPQLLDYLSQLLGDRQYYVAGAAVLTFMDMCPDRIDLIHKHYRGLVRKLVDMDEWGQLATLRLMTTYARLCFPQKTKGPRKTATEGRSSKDFYGEDEHEEASNDFDQALDPDLSLLLRSAQPLLQSRNSAVVTAVARLYLYLTPSNSPYLPSAVSPLVSLLRNSLATQQIVLHSIVQVALALPAPFARHVGRFLVRTTDTPNVRALKLEILTIIFPHCSPHARSLVLAELSHFATASPASSSGDDCLARDAVRAIGRCAQINASDPSDPTSGRCLRLLLSLVSSGEGAANADLVAEALTVVRHLIQAEPSEHVGTVTRLAKNLDIMTSPRGRASTIWLIGEFAGIEYACGGNIAADVLRILAKGFADEAVEAKLQIVLLAAKVQIHNLNTSNADKLPEKHENEEVRDENHIQSTLSSDTSDRVSRLYNYILLLARYDVSYDLRDRARMYRALLSSPTSTQLAALLLLAPKPVPQAPSPSESRRGFVLGSASGVIGADSAGSAGLPGYKSLPEWVQAGKEPDARLRDDDEVESRQAGSVGVPLRSAIKSFAESEDGQHGLGKGIMHRSAPAKEKTLDDWLAEEGEESTDEEESEDEESESEDDEDDEDDEDEDDAETESDGDADEQAKLVRLILAMSVPSLFRPAGFTSPKHIFKNATVANVDFSGRCKKGYKTSCHIYKYWLAEMRGSSGAAVGEPKEMVHHYERMNETMIAGQACDHSSWALSVVARQQFASLIVLTCKSTWFARTPAMPQAYSRLQDIELEAAEQLTPNSPSETHGAGAYHDNEEDENDPVQEASPKYHSQSKYHSWVEFGEHNVWTLVAAAVMLAALVALTAVGIHRLLKRVPGRTFPYCTTWPADYDASYSALSKEPPPLNSSRQVLQGRPKGVKIIGLIFYGRARYVDILDCYLKRNLAVNGGVLDEVHFLKHTERQDDLAFLHDLVEAEPEHYKAFDTPRHCVGGDYGCMWEVAADRDALYVKIDDDIIFIDDDAITHLVQSRIDNPDPFGISANIVNTPVTTYIHYHSGAIQPYLPEHSTKPDRDARPTWRASELSIYSGDPEIDITSSKVNAPYKGHRWLPVDGSRVSKPARLFTPIGQAVAKEELAMDEFFMNWAVAAQQHYSLFANIENDTLARYWPGDGSAFWDTQYTRFNLNFFAVWGKDIAENMPIAADDEKDLTVTLPRRTKRPHLIDLKAVVSHFHFITQNKMILQTDLLDRYRAYANEMVCEIGNKKAPDAERCPGFT